MSNNTGIKRKNRRTVVNLGMIKKEKDGEYYIQIKQQVNVNRCIGETLQEVIDNHREIQRALKNGTYIKKMPDTFNKIMNDMLDEQEANRELKPGSMLRKRRTAELVSQTKFANRPIQKITADEIKADLKMFAELKKTNGKYKYSQSYLDKIFSITKQTFFYGVDNDKLTLEQSPFKTKTKVKKPKAGKKTKKVTALNIEETKLFLKQLTIETDKYKDALWFITLTGVRPSERSCPKVKKVQNERTVS